MASILPGDLTIIMQLRIPNDISLLVTQLAKPYTEMQLFNQENCLRRTGNKETHMLYICVAYMYI